MDADDFAARLAVMEAALAKSGKPDTRKRDDPERALPSVQRVNLKEKGEAKPALPSFQQRKSNERGAVERARVQPVSPKEQAELEQAIPTVPDPIATNAESEASDRSVVLAARIERLDVQLNVINDLLRSLLAAQATTPPPNP